MSDMSYSIDNVILHALIVFVRFFLIVLRYAFVCSESLIVSVRLGVLWIVNRYPLIVIRFSFCVMLYPLFVIR